MYNPSEDMKQIQEMLHAGINKGLPDYRIKVNILLVRIINLALFSTLLILLIYLFF